MKVLILSAFILSTIFLLSCKENENKDMQSSFSSNESHNMGTNCMNCHKDGGSGEGWFKVAGTVYDSNQFNPYPEATVKLYTGANGTGNLIATFEVDQKGNFYTTTDYQVGLYPSVTGKNGFTKYMPSSTLSGQCNNCHDGITTDKIWVK